MTHGQHEGVEYGLVMPFVVCTSKGGPYQDGAYVAGWEAGSLDTTLKLTASGFPAERMVFPQPFHADNRDQIDLIAMQYGMVAEFTDLGDGWVSLTLRRAG